MTQVSEKVLSWLYSVLHEYRDPQRTYSDAARTLSAFPSISPRTEVYTYDTGASALLLTLSGTLPVPFRGTTYRFPVKLWIPHAYPQEAPMAYVMPGKDILVRPGQHVGVDGRIYHPYLSDWNGMWDRASIAEFLEFLSQVFAREPPVISRAQQQQYQRPHGSSQQQTPERSPQPPQRPPKQILGDTATIRSSSTSTPPPLPPKPNDEFTESHDYNTRGPPLPPLPPSHPTQQPGPLPGEGVPPSHQPIQSTVRGYRNGRPPGPAALPRIPQHQTPQRPNHERSPVSPISPMNGYSELPEAKYARPAPLPLPYANQNISQNLQMNAFRPEEQMQQQQFQQHPQHFAPQFPLGQPRPFQPPHPPPTFDMRLQPPQLQRQPLPDLLSDPFEIALPGASASGLPTSAPPIPPNPEKEHLMHALSTTFVQQANQKVAQTLSALAPLYAQQHALQTAHSRLDAEIRQLEQLDQALDRNEEILHRSIQDCDKTIATAKRQKLPSVDEVLVAPTLVANQLWNLCAEEAACREAMYVLQKAVDKGRVSGEVFVRQMRSLGRETFLKRALARKCAIGMGLDLGRGL